MLVGLASLVSGTYLAQYSIEQSWFTFTPYLATLIPSVALLGTGMFGVAAALLDVLKASDDRRRVFFLTYGSVSLAVGIALFFHGVNYSFFVQCADPGGCQEMFLPFWPAFVPGIVMVVTGLFSVVFRIRGIPELPQPLTRSV